MAKPTRIMMMGNPGCGKSTLLNGIAGEPLFLAGISADGGGYLPNIHESKPVHFGGGLFTLCDTPGLMDPSKKQETIRQVNVALKQDRETKLVFVTSLRNGRVVDEDATAIRMILEAINKESKRDVDDHFAVIINQLGDREHKKLVTDEKRLLGKVAVLLNETARTSHILCLPFVEELEEKNNAVPSRDFISQYRLVHFLMELPIIVTEANKVKAITEQKISNANEEMMKLLKQLQSENNALRLRLESEHAERIKQARQRWNPQPTPIQMPAPTPTPIQPPMPPEMCSICHRAFGPTDTKVTDIYGRVRHLAEAQMGAMLAPHLCRPGAQFGMPGIC